MCEVCVCVCVCVCVVCVCCVHVSVCVCVVYHGFDTVGTLEACVYPIGPVNVLCLEATQMFTLPGLVYLLIQCNLSNVIFFLKERFVRFLWDVYV